MTRRLFFTRGGALGSGRSGLLPGHVHGAVSDAALRTITVDYTVEFARVLHSSSPGTAFSFLSGNGADPTGRCRMPFARNKGEAENALLAAGFPHVYIFRPAYIYPNKYFVPELQSHTFHASPPQTLLVRLC